MIRECNFNFASINSKAFSVVLCEIEQSGYTENVDENYNIITSTNPYKDTFDLHGVIKNNPLEFEMTICKYMNKKFSHFSPDEIRQIKKWLGKSEYNWLQIDQNDILNIHYRCIINNFRSADTGLGVIGLKFTVTCDAPYPWTSLIKRSFTSNNNGVNILLNPQTDFEDYIVRPLLTITSKANQTIEIKNNSLTDTRNGINIKNCTNGEIITIDCRNYKIKSSKNRFLMNDWNKGLLEMIDGKNQIYLKGNFDIIFEYRLPMRIGG